MSNSVSTLNGAAEVSAAAAKYLPEPATKGMGIFRDVVDLVSSVGEGVIGGIPTAATGDYASLIQLQLEAQREMQTTTMVSNIEKSKHESKMSAVRNIRVS